METITIWSVMAILLAHYVCDFIFQSRWMAENKSSNPAALLIHVTIYSILMTVCLSIYTWAGTSTPFPGDPDFMVPVLQFLGVTFVAHAVTDYASSSITSTLHQANANHDFFVVVGADQVAHYIQLFITYQWVFGSPALT